MAARLPGWGVSAMAGVRFYAAGLYLSRGVGQQGESAFTAATGVEGIQYLRKYIVGGDGIKKGHAGAYFHGINPTENRLRLHALVLQERVAYLSQPLAQQRVLQVAPRFLPPADAVVVGIVTVAEPPKLGKDIPDPMRVFAGIVYLFQRIGIRMMWHILRHDKALDICIVHGGIVEALGSAD